MHSKTLILLAAFVVSSSLGNPPRAASADATQAQRELTNLEEKWLHALSDADIQEQILADDFVHALPSGFITKKDQLITFGTASALPTISRGTLRTCACASMAQRRL